MQKSKLPILVFCQKLHKKTGIIHCQDIVPIQGYPQPTVLETELYSTTMTDHLCVSQSVRYSVIMTFWTVMVNQAIFLLLRVMRGFCV